MIRSHRLHRARAKLRMNSCVFRTKIIGDWAWFYIIDHAGVATVPDRRPGVRHPGAQSGIWMECRTEWVRHFRKLGRDTPMDILSVVCVIAKVTFGLLVAWCINFEDKSVKSLVWNNIYFPTGEWPISFWGNQWNFYKRVATGSTTKSRTQFLNDSRNYIIFWRLLVCGRYMGYYYGLYTLREKNK